MANIKISQLPSIGNSLSASTILPVVNTTGTLTTDKVAVGNIANFTLLQAGNTLPPAFVANVAYNVTNAAQPNITSVGNLTGLRINNINNFHIPGGTNGYVLQTDGTGNLSWVAGGGSGNGTVGGSNSQLQFNLSGSFAGDPDLTWDAGNNKLVTANLSVSANANVGNVNAANVNVTANLRPNAIYTDNYYYANGYVFGGGGGNGTPGGNTTQVQFNDSGVFGGNTGFTFNKTSGVFTAPFLAGNGNGLANIQGANVTGFVPNANVANTAFAVAGANVTGAVSFATTANSVAVANVVGIGNISTLALDGSNSNVLYGNGIFAPVSGGGNPFDQELNTTDNVQFANVTSTEAIKFSNSGNIVGALGYAPTFVSIEGYQGNSVNITANDVHTWSFDQYGTLYFPGNTIAVDDIEGTNNFGFETPANVGFGILTDLGNNEWSFGTDGNLTIPGTITSNNTITIDNRASGNGADINLYSADDILIQARDRDAGATSEGGDINIYAGDSAVDSDSSAGDIVIEAGAGGASNIDFGGAGGFIRIEAGLGGAASTDANGFSALSGGTLTLRAGDAGTNNGNIDRGSSGGDVYIEAGDTTANGDPGGSIILTAGTAGANALAGQIQLNIPSSDNSDGGTWTFNGDGNLVLPNNSKIAYSGNITQINTCPNGFLGLNSYDAGSNNIARVNISSIDELVSIGLSDPITENDYNWTFDITGNLTLPGNTWSVNYANGTQVPIGAAQLGNVTFDNQIVIGTGDEFGGGGLYLAPGPAEIANGQYLQVRGGDQPSHIHFDTGNNNFYDQYFGNDNKYVKLSAGADGNILIGTDGNTGNLYRWTFDSSGELTVPGDIQSITTGFAFNANINGINTSTANVVIVTLTSSPFGGPFTGQVTISGVVGTTDANGTWYFEASEANEFQLYYDEALQYPVDGTGWNAYVSGGLAVAAGYNDLGITGGNVSITTNNGDTWTFANNGSIIFPTLTVDIHNGGNQTAQTLQFGDNTQQAIITGPTPSADVNAQRLIIQGQRGNGQNSEGGDVYFWAGDADTYGGDIKIYAGDADNVSAGYGGYINLTGGQGFNEGGYINITGGRSTNSGGAYVGLTGGQGSTTGGNIDLTGGYGGGSGGNVNIIGGVAGNGLGSYGNINITAGASTWTFDNTGSFVFPGAGVTMDGQTNSLLTSGIANVTIGTFVQGADGGVSWEYQGDGSGNSSYGAVGLDTGGTANTANLRFKVQLVSDQGNASTNKEWLFDTSGNLTLPGNTFSVNYANGAQVNIGGGSGNTGNVTFDDVTVQGVNQLNLSAGPDYTANLAYLQVRAGDVASHIHFDTGNNEAYDLIIGNDQKFVQVSSTGNIIMSSYDGNTSYGMTLDTDGNLNIPGNISVGGTASITATNDSGSPGGPGGPTFTAELNANPGIDDIQLGWTVTGNNLVGVTTVTAISIVGPVYEFYTDTGVTNPFEYNSDYTFTSPGATWSYDNTGSLTLPSISLGNSLNEETVIQSQRKIIPAFRWSAEIGGSTPTVVYSATNNLITSMKVTMQIQHTGLGMEFFEVYATSAGGDTYYSVSNRLQPSSIANSTVVVDMNGSNTMQITVTINSGAANSWVTYDAVEFGIPQD